MSSVLRRISACLVSGCILAVAGSVASARMSGPQTFKPAEGMIQELGTKRAIGFFLRVGGTCKMTLMIAEAVGADEAQPAPAASMSLDLTPGQSVALGSTGGESLVATCGAGAETIEIKRTPPRS